MRNPSIEIPRPLVDRLRRLALARGLAGDDLRPLIVEALREGYLPPDGPPPLPPRR
jgi:hypothetical protein